MGVELTRRVRRAAVRLVCCILLAATGSAVAAADRGPGVPGVRGGVVATSQPEAARVGAEVLRAGGNAIDAAVAVAFALNVVEPQSSGIGGGGFMVIHLADGDRTVTVDSREAAPAAATPDMFMPFVKGDVPVKGFDGASTSGVSVGVPGMVRGVALALHRWGTMSWSRVIRPAAELAGKGFRVGPRMAESVRSQRLGSEPGNPAYDEARKVFRPGGNRLERGDLLVQPDLARTLNLLAEKGPDAFYTGPIARAIVATQRHSRGEAQAGRGRMTLDDLAGYRARVREPVTGRYRGYTVKGMGPPSSGGLTVIEILKMLRRFPLGDEEAGFGFGTTRTLNTMVEAMRLAFADRAVWMGDSDYVDVPAAGLLDDGYIARRSRLIDPEARLAHVTADDPRPFESAGTGGPQRIAMGPESLRKGRNTTHFVVVDRDGNVVSYTNTVESAWGTGLMVPGYGFMLNNELTDFNFRPARDRDPGHFNPGANDVAGGKRPRSSMSPVILFRGGEPVAAYGSPGGSTIIDTVVDMTLNLIDHHMTVQEAIDAPRIAETHANGPVYREIGFDAGAIRGLEALGQEVSDPFELGSVQAVVIDPATGLQYGGADRRRVGATRSLRRADLSD